MKATYTALREFGASFLGPPLTVYIRAVEKEVAGKLPVCLAREGWLLHRLLNHLSEQGLVHLELAPIYLRVSRTLLFRAMLGEAPAWDMALNLEFKGTVLELMMKRFGLQLNEVCMCMPSEVLSFKVELPARASEVKEWLAPHVWRLKEQVAPTRRAVYHYLQAQGLTEGHATPLMLDLGYSGSIQKLCTWLIQRDTAGLYFVTTMEGRQSLAGHGVSMKGVFREGVAWTEKYSLLERSLLLECMMTAPHSQVVDIRLSQDGDHIFFYGREASGQRYYQDLEVVLTGAIDAVTEAFRNQVEYSVEEIEALYEVFATRSHAIPRAAWHLFAADDGITGNDMIYPLKLFGINQVTA